MTTIFSKERVLNKVISINIKDIIPNPYQPRKDFNMIELENLALSIKQNGILQPLTVRKNLLGQYELISGERRLRASRLVGLKTVPCITIETDQKQSAILSILENVQRQDLSFFEEAKAISALLLEWGITQEEAAVRLGKAQSTIANKLRLLKLSNREQIIILNSRLTERHARSLLKLSNVDQRLKIINHIIENNLNVSQTDTYIDNIISGNIDINNSSIIIEDIDLSNQEAQTENSLPNSKSKKIKIPIVKDIRLFLNSINKAIDTMKSAGVDAYTEKNQTDNYVEYVVRIPLATS